MVRGPKKPEDRTGNAIRDALKNVAPDNVFGKVEGKIWKFLEKAATTSEEGKTWTDIIESFLESFCNATINLYSKEPWFQMLDLSPVVQEAVYDLLPAAKFRGVHQHHLHQFLVERFHEVFGRIEQEVHIDNVVREIAESIFNVEEDKALLKKLHGFLWKAWTATRESVLAEMVKNRRKDPADLADDFARKWIDDACGRLWSSFSETLRDTMPEEVAMRMFQDLFQRGSLPTPITNIVGPPPRGWRVVNVSVADAFMRHDPANAGMWESKYPRRQKRKAPSDSPAWEPVTEDSPWAPKKFKSEGNAPKAAAPATGGGGCLECTSGEECVGSPDADLYKHVDRSSPDGEGDIYCAACWASFTEDNPDLEGELLPRASL